MTRSAPLAKGRCNMDSIAITFLSMGLPTLCSSRRQKGFVWCHDRPCSGGVHCWHHRMDGLMSTVLGPCQAKRIQSKIDAVGQPPRPVCESEIATVGNNASCGFFGISRILVPCSWVVRSVIIQEACSCIVSCFLAMGTER